MVSSPKGIRSISSNVSAVESVLKDVEHHLEAVKSKDISKEASDELEKKLEELSNFLSKEERRTPNASTKTIDMELKEKLYEAIADLIKTSRHRTTDGNLQLNIFKRMIKDVRQRLRLIKERIVVKQKEKPEMGGKSK